MSAQVQDVEIEGLVAPDSPPQDRHHIALQSELLAVMQRRYGPYPWRHISFVVVPQHASAAAGMEYPTFYSSEAYETGQWPPWLYINRFGGIWTTIHEFGHQYFQGMVASDEHQAPWIDEGLNTLTDVLVFEDIFGKNAALVSYAGYPKTATDALREVLYGPPFDVAINQPASQFWSYPDNYGSTVYARCALVWLTLRNLCGHDTFDQALRSYVDTFRFAHPSADQVKGHFIQTLGPRCGQGPKSVEISRYLTDTLDTPFLLDYAVKVLPSRRTLAPAGWTLDPQDLSQAPKLQPPSPTSSSQYEQVVLISRQGTPIVPLEYELHWKDGRIEQRVWSPTDDSAPQSAGTFRLVLQGDSLARVVLDPHEKLAIERSRLNNVAIAPGAELSSQEAQISKAPLSLTRALVYALGNLLP